MHVYRGLSCGFVAGQRINKLGLECMGSSEDPRFLGLPPTAGGRSNLRRLQVGHFPSGVQAWPADQPWGPEVLVEL